MAGMERLELSKPGLKNLSRDRFAFIPVSNNDAGEENRTPKTLVLSERCLPGCITPAHSHLHASRFTRHKLVAESGVAPDDLLVMSQPSLVPAPSPHQEHAVRVELTISGFADRRLNQLGYACHKFLELRAGIEPAPSPWQGDVIPLDQRSC